MPDGRWRTRPVENRGLIIICRYRGHQRRATRLRAIKVFGLETTLLHLQTSAEGIGWISGFLNGSSTTWPSNPDAARPFSYDHRLA